MQDQQARFEAVVLPHLDAAYRMARRLVRNPAEADDLVQESFLKAYRAFDQFELRSYGAKPWLLKILHNTYKTRVGKQIREPALMDDSAFGDFASELEDPPATELADVNWEWFDEELKHAVESLSAELREALLLWSLEGLSYKEIADVCGCAMGTVMSRLYRARQQVGRQLAAYAEEHRLRSDRFES